MADPNLLILVSEFEELREMLANESDPQRTIILTFWIKEFEDDLLCGYVALVREFERAWDEWKSADTKHNTVS